MSHGQKISVIGLGYVGLPVKVAFARGRNSVVGFDINTIRVHELKEGCDRTCEVNGSDLRCPSLSFTTDSLALKSSDFFIVTVPTPIDAARRPDLGAMFEASRLVGSVLKKGDIVVYESTVYPGALEEECIPILERCSHLAAGADFNVGYSPERINPGDKHHRFETITKVVAAQNPETLGVITDVYGSVVTAGIHRAPSIKVAEAAKVIENTQRDLNIAFMNELSLIFKALDIDAGDVLGAARTKWNFMPFHPGLVGGALYWRGPVLPDLSRRNSRLSSRNYSGRPPHQRWHGAADRAGMRARSAASKRSGRRCHDPWPDLQGRRSRYAQLSRR
jgi:UDP-N-acetyl-D-glucosamine/UDP-N-acetyl-D-galactosamine dehydrogenase